MLICSIFYSNQDMEAGLKNQTGERIKVCYNAILLHHKKEWNSTIYNSGDGPKDY